MTKDGLERIDSVSINELVLAKDTKTGEIGWKRVQDRHVSRYRHTVRVRVTKTGSGQEEIVSNRIHPVFVKGTGWTEIGKLAPGDELLTADDTWGTVVSIKVEDTPLKAFNLTVADHHTYFIGNAKLWVKNCPAARPSVLQTGGQTFSGRAAKSLNKHFNMNLSRREWGRALEEMKRDLGLPNSHHGRILSDGTYTDEAGRTLGNISNYLP